MVSYFLSYIHTPHHPRWSIGDFADNISTVLEMVLLVKTEHVTGEISTNPFRSRKAATSLKAQTPSLYATTI
jgi:hypothetical protein